MEEGGDTDHDVSELVQVGGSSSSTPQPHPSNVHALSQGAKEAPRRHRWLEGNTQPEEGHPARPTAEQQGGSHGEDDGREKLPSDQGNVQVMEADADGEVETPGT